MLYGYSGSLAYLNVSEKSFALFLEHASNAPTTSTATGKRGGKVVNVSPIQSFSKETRAVMQVKNYFNLICCFLLLFYFNLISYLLFCKSDI